MVIDGEVDIGLARSLNHPEVETMTLRNDPLVLVGHPSHPAARKQQVRLEEVESWPLIFYDRGSSDWTLSQSLFRRAGLLPNVVLEVETIEACKVTRQKACALALKSPVHTMGRLLLARSWLTSAICSRWPISRHFWALPRTSAGFWKFMK